MQRNSTTGVPPSGVRSTGSAVACIRGHLERGAPWDACDEFREAVAQVPGDVELLYWGALAHARAGASHQAHAFLDRAQALAPDGTGRLADILSLRGRLWKDVLHRRRDMRGVADAAERARAEYLAAYALQRDPYPGINAASLSMLLGDRAAAGRLANEILERLDAQTAPRTCWDHATAGEARLLLGQWDEARARYTAAGAQASGSAGSIATMRRQIRLLARAVPEAARVLDVLPAPAVLAFAGHLVDTPDRATPRFPAELEPAVDAAIRERLARLHAPIVYTSAACGADVIMIEAALDRGAEVNVLLPFNRDDFVRTSVAVGGDRWLPRFDAALARATRVIAATQESHLGDDVLFEHAAMLVEGLTALRAAQLETEPSLLCVIDAAAAGRIGGTRGTHDRWKERFGPPDVVDLAGLRARAAGEGRAAVAISPRAAAPSVPPPAPSGLSPRPSGTVSDSTGDLPDASGHRPDAPERPRDAPAADVRLPAARPRRTLKTLLFADFAGYSRLHDAYAPLFQGRFWNIVAEQFEQARAKPLMANSWGDAIYAVFESPEDGAEFALRLQASMDAVDWTAAGLADTSRIRIALHAGPVFCGFDPIMGRDNYFGSSVTRTARIEPVTPPGMVYASEAFAANLAATGRDDYALEYVGELALAKGYGASRIYRLDRR